MMHLTTTGRRTGQERGAIVGYFEDGPNLVTLAMNGWAEAEPAWRLNLQAHPEASVEVADGRRTVRGRAAAGEERERLWARWQEIDANMDAYAERRPGETAVVILERLKLCRIASGSQVSMSPTHSTGSQRLRILRPVVS
jgi:deazaflavin-dependent oxidoreductase (nitroreductase family)